MKLVFIYKLLPNPTKMLDKLTGRVRHGELPRNYDTFSLQNCSKMELFFTIKCSQCFRVTFVSVLTVPIVRLIPQAWRF